METAALKSAVAGNQKLEVFIVHDNISVKKALKQMDIAGGGILIVADSSDKVCGTITDGDIRRWILQEGNLNAPVLNFYRRNPKLVPESYDPTDVTQIMLRYRIDAVPVVDEKGCLKNILFWDDLLSEKKPPKGQSLSTPVVIMAGGKGVRMDPITRILPKPLIPLGDKPIVEVVMDHFAKYGCRSFYLIVNYKGKMVQSYFESADCDYDIHFVWEDAPLGTAGGLIQIKKLIEAQSFFVTNCDVVIKADYADIWQYHNQTNADITIVGSMRHFSIPYGVLETRNGGCLERIIEKPEYDLLANTGLYVVRKRVLKHIPENKPFDFPELIETVRIQGGKIQVYPISQKSWLDAGEWQEYKNTLRQLQL